MSFYCNAFLRTLVKLWLILGTYRSLEPTSENNVHQSTARTNAPFSRLRYFFVFSVLQCKPKYALLWEATSHEANGCNCGAVLRFRVKLARKVYCIIAIDCTMRFLCCKYLWFARNSERGLIYGCDISKLKRASSYSIVPVSSNLSLFLFIK